MYSLPMAAQLQEDICIDAKSWPFEPPSSAAEWAARRKSMLADP